LISAGSSGAGGVGAAGEGLMGANDCTTTGNAGPSPTTFVQTASTAR
jgi:hypothetical protein